MVVMFFVDTTHLDGCQHMRVYDLMHSNRGSWDSDMMEGLFASFDV